MRQMKSCPRCMMYAHVMVRLTSPAEGGRVGGAPRTYLDVTGRRGPARRDPGHARPRSVGGPARAPLTPPPPAGGG